MLKMSKFIAIFYILLNLAFAVEPNLIIDNKSYSIDELKIDKNSSSFSMNIKMHDAQSGISYMIEILHLAKKRGFKFITFTKGKENRRDVVKFFVEKPANKEKLFAVDEYLNEFKRPYKIK